MIFTKGKEVCLKRSWYSKTTSFIFQIYIYFAPEIMAIMMISSLR